MEYFLDNRSVIKNFCFNTGTSSAPVYTPACTASELSLAEASILVGIPKAPSNYSPLIN